MVIGLELGCTVAELIKNTCNIRVYRPRVFYVGSGPNQSHSPECDWEHISSFFTWGVRGRT